jgi:hypothetical protein
MLLCVCSVSSIISFNCTMRYAAVPLVNVNSVPLLRLGVTLHSQSPASRHFPSPLTKQVWLSMWTGCWGMMFGGTVILCGDLSGMTGNHNRRRCRRPVKSNECEHNVTMHHVMYALIRRAEGGETLSSLTQSGWHWWLGTWRTAGFKLITSGSNYSANNLMNYWFILVNTDRERAWRENVF